jgi:hypothetical protein
MLFKVMRFALAEAHFHFGSAAANELARRFAAAIGRVLWGYASIDSVVGPVS